MSGICDQHGRLRCSECAYIEELKEIIDGLAKERHDLINECDDLKDTVFVAVKALEHYAEWIDWEDDSMGDKARKALKEIKRISTEGVSQ